jgi:hypothetical protein
MHFDPFRRRDRIRFFYTKDDFIDTTIGQLNLFRWILTNGILSYIYDHKGDIEEDMMQAQRDSQYKKRRQGGISSSSSSSSSGSGSSDDLGDDSANAIVDNSGDEILQLNRNDGIDVDTRSETEHASSERSSTAETGRKQGRRIGTRPDFNNKTRLEHAAQLPQPNTEKPKPLHHTAAKSVLNVHHHKGGAMGNGRMILQFD